MAGAEEAYRATIEVDPRYANAHNNLAYLLLTEHRDLKGADAAYSAALAIDPTHKVFRAGRLFTRASLAEQRGRGLTAAAEQFDEAAELWGAELGADHEAAVMARTAAVACRERAARQQPKKKGGGKKGRGRK